MFDSEVFFADGESNEDFVLVRLEVFASRGLTPSPPVLHYNCSYGDDNLLSIIRLQRTFA